VRKVNLGLLISIVVLSFYSLTALYVINVEKFVLKQVVYILVGFLLFLFISSINFRVLKFYAVPLYIFSFLLLLAVLVIGVAINSSKRWINVFGFFSIQPSEFTKISLILMFAWIFEKNYNNFEKFAFSVLVLIPVSAIVFLQPDMGTSLVFAFIFFLLISFSLPIKYPLSLVAIVLAFVPFLPKILKPYQMERILTFFDPYRDPLGSGYNVLQSIITFGSGKLFGKGLSQSTMSRLNFVPVQYADFILSAIGEIWGFFGIIVVLACFAYILYFSIRAYSLTKNKFGKYIALGVFAMMFFQILVNMGMNMGIMPVTGIPLPFLSFGGSAMLTNFIALGLVQSVYNFRDELNL